MQKTILASAIAQAIYKTKVLYEPDALKISKEIFNKIKMNLSGRLRYGDEACFYAVYQLLKALTDAGVEDCYAAYGGYNNKEHWWVECWNRGSRFILDLGNKYTPSAISHNKLELLAVSAPDVRYNCTNIYEPFKYFKKYFSSLNKL